MAVSEVITQQIRRGNRRRTKYNFDDEDVVEVDSYKDKTWASQTVSGWFDTRVGGKQVHIGTYYPIRDIVCLQGKITVVHWVVFPQVVKREPWVIALDVMSPSEYVRRRLFNKDRFHLWDFPEDLWMQINNDQLGFLWI